MTDILKFILEYRVIHRLSLLLCVIGLLLLIKNKSKNTKIISISIFIELYMLSYYLAYIFSFNIVHSLILFISMVLLIKGLLEIVKEFSLKSKKLICILGVFLIVNLGWGSLHIYGINYCNYTGAYYEGQVILAKVFNVECSSISPDDWYIISSFNSTTTP